MRQRLGPLLALGLLSVLPNTAAADSPSWLAIPVCTSGALSVCLSVQNVSWNSATNELSFTIVNEAPELGMTHTITRLGFYHDATGSPWSGTVSIVEGLNGWATDPNAIYMNGSGFELDLTVGTNGIQKGIRPDGSATFVLKLSSEFVFDQSAQLRWHSQSVGTTGESIKCDTGWNDPNPGGSYPPCEPITIVPEPLTIVLLGTGLAGVGGVTWRRRRREGAAIETD